MDRRTFIASSLLTVGISQVPVRATAKTLKMVTFVPEKNSPLYLGAREFVRRVSLFSGGALTIEMVEFSKLKSTSSNPLALLRDGSVDMIHGYIEEFKGTDISLREGTRRAWRNEPTTKALFSQIDGQLGIKTLVSGIDSTPNLIWVSSDKVRTFSDLTRSRIRTRAFGLGSAVISNFRAPIEMPTIQAVSEYRAGGLEAIECANPCYDLYLEMPKHSVAYAFSPWQNDGITVEVAFGSQTWSKMSATEKAALEYGAQRSSVLTDRLLTERNREVFAELNASGLKKIEALPDESEMLNKAIAKAHRNDDRRARLLRHYEQWIQSHEARA